MKLFHNPASPFVRKVLITASYKGVREQIELVDVTVSPVNPVDDVNRMNPVGKIPTLVLDDGNALFDSRVICDYLDNHGNDVSLTPAGEARWADRKIQAIGDGICDAAVLARYELAMRPQEKQWDNWLEGQMSKVFRSLDYMEANAAALGQQPTIGHIALVCALGYLDFRFADQPWREGRPGLTAWFEEFSASDAYKNTAPQG